MPKLKTRKSAAKRFKITGSGKIMRRHAMRNHLLEKKTTARKSRLFQKELVAEGDIQRVKDMLPYSR
ncbi:LSU ribosomal protein L35P [Thalassoporum mexicanum PCC 7367]|uniref:50S ribosomal protein L35 n=1 Tax=Thalassoporum mexicanum TaxID=3457544 RepID=UPI0002A00009|nr:50S ribosomal protein L35 [Pseudanabaena sp. PCC 7367]AFY68963.1 LSU ribosomal protein L35P [Pseudanabaena sp. PCC 7367]